MSSMRLEWGEVKPTKEFIDALKWPYLTDCTVNDMVRVASDLRGAERMQQFIDKVTEQVRNGELTPEGLKAAA